MSKPDGGPAFPSGKNSLDAAGPNGGMTLRDYFAAAALQGFWSQPAKQLTHEQTIENATAEMCEHFYRWADAMLIERTK